MNGPGPDGLAVGLRSPRPRQGLGLDTDGVGRPTENESVGAARLTVIQEPMLKVISPLAQTAIFGAGRVNRVGENEPAALESTGCGM